MVAPSERRSPHAAREGAHDESELLFSSLLFLSNLAVGRAQAACPSNTDSGITYSLAFPLSADSSNTGTVVIMTDANATVTYDDPCGSPGLYYPTPSAPSYINVTCSGAQYYDNRDTGPDSGYIIGLGRIDAAVPSLHVVFKINGYQSSDAFMVIPQNPDRRGNAYWTLGHRGSSLRHSRWLAVADTDMELNFKDCSGADDSEDVAAGQVLQEFCAPSTTFQDGTGNFVSSTDDENFGLITGADCGRVPVGTGACDVLAEMLPGEEWWGTEYLVTEFNKRSGGGFVQGDLIRIVSTTGSVADPNDVTFTPVGGGTILTNGSSGHACSSTTGHSFSAAGDWCDIRVVAGATITAEDFPIVVGQLMKGVVDAGVGDPSLSLVLPTDRFRCGGRFFSFEGFDEDAAGNGSYVNIVAPTDVIDDITLDGEALDVGVKCGGYDPIDFGSGYSWTECLLADPAAGGSQHILDSGTTPIGVYVYGQIVDGSYAYVAGMSF